VERRRVTVEMMGRHHLGPAGEGDMHAPARTLASDEEGATSVEYAILASFIAAVIAAAASMLGQKIFAIFQDFSSRF